MLTGERMGVICSPLARLHRSSLAACASDMGSLLRLVSIHLIKLYPPCTYSTCIHSKSRKHQQSLPASPTTNPLSVSSHPSVRCYGPLRTGELTLDIAVFVLEEDDAVVWRELAEEAEDGGCFALCRGGFSVCREESQERENVRRRGIR